MNTIFKLLTSGFMLCGVIISAHAGDNSLGIEYYKAGQLDPAKMEFLKQLNNTNNSGLSECCYYLGEIYFSEGKADSASFYFKKGETYDPNYVLNKIGEGKLLLKNNPEAANDLFNEALSGKNKKNAELQVAVAKAYFSAGQETYKEHLAKAIDSNEKYPDSYILEGDIAAANKDYGKASGKYELAIHYDNNCTEAYFKYAYIYSAINPELSVNMLQKLLEISPNSLIAKRLLAETYYNSGQMSKASEIYAQIIASNQHNNADISRYATLLFFNKEYDKSLSLVKSELQKNNRDLVMKRLAMYNCFELGNFSESIEAAEQFMKDADPKDIIGLDYIYHGRILNANKQFEKATAQFEKAIALDTSKIELYKELAEIYENANNYTKAIDSYNTYLNSKSNKIQLSDYYLAGKCCYNAGTNPLDSVSSPEKKKDYLLAADGFFTYMTEKLPDNYLGYFWRARVNSSLDPETEQGLAKPYYEKALSILLQENKDSKKIIECNSYLGYYHFLKKDIPLSKEYWNKILTIDSENAVAKRALDGMK